jgi:2-polyprenyl-3-methyl-5-hydroxy-6-metoxy-1,4-benzoquinol methylase
MAPVSPPATGPDRLDQLDFSAHDGLNALTIDFRYRDLARFYQGTSCLEFGCADGRGLELLLERFESVTAVDGSARLLEETRRRIDSPRLTLVHALFEDLQLGRTFDTVQMGHILEHVDEPRRVIQVGIDHLAPDGVLIADVPNADSIHRHVGVSLGLIQQVTDLNEGDRRIGHQRVYTWARFRQEFESLGLRIVDQGGVFCKPLSNAQLEQVLSPEQIRAFFEVGKRFPEIAAEIYVVCKR